MFYPTGTTGTIPVRCHQTKLALKSIYQQSMVHSAGNILLNTLHAAPETSIAHSGFTSTWRPAECYIHTVAVSQVNWQHSPTTATSTFI